jgi:hypothetical protein
MLFFQRKEMHVMLCGPCMQHARESSEDVSEQTEKIPDIALMFRVLYDTPTGDVSLTVTGYTADAAARGVKCQIGHRPAGGAEQRSDLMSLDAVMKTETKAPVLDGDALYVHLIDTDGREIAVSKIDETKWPRDATPTTVQAKSYWLSVPSQNLVR